VKTSRRTDTAHKHVRGGCEGEEGAQTRSNAEQTPYLQSLSVTIKRGSDEGARGASAKATKAEPSTRRTGRDAQPDAHPVEGEIMMT
jgi:hypothetical protein